MPTSRSLWAPTQHLSGCAFPGLALREQEGTMGVAVVWKQAGHSLPTKQFVCPCPVWNSKVCIQAHD